MNEEIKKNGKEEVKPDILDQIKRAEMAVKQATLIKMMGEVKRMASQVLELKEKCTAMLTEIGLSADDVKRVIDFVNNLSSVQLNDADREIIRKWAKDEVQGKRKDIEKKIEDRIKPYEFLVTSQNISSATIDAGVWSGATSGNPMKFGNQTMCSDMVFCSDDGKELKVNL